MRSLVHLGAAAAAFTFLIPPVPAQLVNPQNPIPNTGKPPVVFLNGYQNTCSGTTFAGTFGTADRVLQGDGRVSIFFDNCSIPSRPSIEELGNELGKLLRGLRFEGGQAVRQVDIVAHSMGGLIARSYLSGKQADSGVFTPPAETLVRKIVFLATPHFGTGLNSGTGDRQITALQTGSTFLFDLATWNQGTDDLRGVDAISVLGDAGTGIFVGIRGFDDTTTSLSSGSLGFVAPGRTRILPYCHTDGLALLGCRSGALPIAQMNSTEHLSAQIVLSFLNNTENWRNIGQSPEQHELFSRRGGLLLRSRDANDHLVTPSRAQAQAGASVSLRESSALVYGEYLTTEQPLQLTLTLPGGSTSASIPVAAGATRALTLKPGPVIDAILPSAAAIFPRAAAPGSLISIYGSELTTASGQPEVFVAGQRMSMSYAAANQINTTVPDNVSGLIKLQVKTSAGERTVNLLIEPVVPAIFAPALNAVAGTLVTAESPLHPGDYVALFLTGLGRTTARDGLDWAVVQPEVSFGGQPCVLSYAGRAPGFPGLDQINCQISSTLPANTAAQVVVRSGTRVSNVTTLPVR